MNLLENRFRIQVPGIVRHVFCVILLVLVGALNLYLLANFNTVIWPTLWPKPLIYFAVCVLIVTIWYPRITTSVWALRLVGLLVVFIGQSYVLHTVQVTFEQPTPLALIHLVGITGMFFTVALSYFNQARPKNNRVAPRLPKSPPYVAVVIPTYGEPINILEQTVASIVNLDYPVSRLYILISDDGRRQQVRKLAEQYGIHYYHGPRRDAKAGNLNSALKHLEHDFPAAELILTQDADELVDPSFLKKTVGYFRNPRVALVQTPKEAITPRGDPFGTRDRMFYDVLQVGRNGSNAAFACGSGVIWRIDAVKSIGGFVTWNVVEDLTTSYILHRKGYTSEYHNEILSIGLAPDDIPNLLKQRTTWATDTWRLFLYENPLRRPGLTLLQRLQYLELGTFYTTSTFFTPMLMLVPLISLATGEFLPIEGSALFPWVAAIALYYIVLAKRQGLTVLRHWQYWIGHWPTYTRGLLMAIGSRYKKPTYRVTRKTRKQGFYGLLLWPQFLYVILGIAMIVRGIWFMPEAALQSRMTNVGILAFFVYMMSRICIASFYGVRLFGEQKVASLNGRPKALALDRELRI